MTDKEFKRLNRVELIEIIYQLKKNEANLLAENTELKKQLADRNVKIANAGSIAEATVAISNIFGVAQQTADNYLRSIYEMGASAEQQAQQIIADAQWQAQMIISQAHATAGQQAQPGNLTMPGNRTM